MTIPILQIRELRHSEINLAQGHTAPKYQSWDSSPLSHCVKHLHGHLSVS